MPKGRKARSETRSKGKPYVKSGSTNSDHDDNVPNQAVGEEEEPAICVVCDAVIQDPTEDDPSSGDQALFCDENVLDYQNQPTLQQVSPKHLFIVCIVYKLYMLVKLLS